MACQELARRKAQDLGTPDAFLGHANGAHSGGKESGAPAAHPRAPTSRVEKKIDTQKVCEVRGISSQHLHCWSLPNPRHVPRHKLTPPSPPCHGGTTGTGGTSVHYASVAHLTPPSPPGHGTARHDTAWGGTGRNPHPPPVFTDPTENRPFKPTNMERHTHTHWAKCAFLLPTDWRGPKAVHR